jgi:hypothetical protein
MWNIVPIPGLVANPAKGSNHNKGAAVDLTLVDLTTGKEFTNYNIRFNESEMIMEFFGDKTVNIEIKFTNEYERFLEKNRHYRKKNIFLRNQVIDRERLQTTFRNISEEIQREKQQVDQKKKELKSIGAIEFDEKQYLLIRTGVSEAYRHYQALLVKLNEIKRKTDKFWGI